MPPSSPSTRISKTTTSSRATWEPGWRAAQTGAVIANLTGVGVVTIEGPDARRFANGMFTQNVNALASGSATRSAFCDDRGRMLGMMDLYCTGLDAFLAVLEGVSAADFVDRFARFVIFDELEMTDRTDEVALVTLQGAGTDTVWQAGGHGAPDQGWVGDSPHGVGRHDRTGLGGFDFLLPRADREAALEGLEKAGAMPVASEVLEVLRVEAGLPCWPVDMGERAFPHEMGLRDTTLDFDKGCYVGQEIINRMDTRGTMRRQLSGLRVEGEELVPVGAVVTADGKEVGVLTSPVWSP
ncbi:MAG: folate-binding protein YgfZ, partial [Deltaproteobacteria bacterium]|nr:folate-binding protein YgfZ [Deltaproteobacteria bacterium]